MRKPTAVLLPQAQDVRQACAHASLYDTVHYLRRTIALMNLAGGSQAVQFAHAADYTFPTGDLVNLTAAQPAQTSFTLKTTVLGLTGTVSPLPEVLIEHLAQPDAAPASLAFLQILEHRVMTLLCDGVLQHRIAQRFRTDASDMWSQHFLGWSAGCKAGLPQWRRLRWLPLLCRRPTAARLQAAVRDLFGEGVVASQVKLVQRTGGWLPTTAQQHWRLGSKRSSLGGFSVLGSRMQCPSHRFDVVIGPLQASEYQWCVENKSALLTSLAATVRLFVRSPIVCRVRLRLTASAQRSWHLGHAHTLGRTSFVGHCRRETTLPFSEDCYRYAS